MANITGLLSTTIKDALGVETSFPVYVETSDANTLVHLIADAQAYQLVLDNVIDGLIIGQELKITVPLDAVKTAFTGTAEVERNALFNFSQASIKYKQGFAVPTIAEAAIVNGKVDLTNSSIIAFFNLLITGGTYLKFTSKFVNALLALLDVVISFRKHRKRETAVSFEEGS
jgi:hypothetical protein